MPVEFALLYQRIALPGLEMESQAPSQVPMSVCALQLILPYLDLKIEYYDLGLPNRDKTDDKVTHDAAHAILVGETLYCFAFV